VPAVPPVPPVSGSGGGGDFHSTLAAHGVSGASIAILDEQAVDEAVVGELTDADLKEFGITQWGERKKILAAAKQFA
jgi:SAM domain (Sterile alpha motif)